jgi:hypothetical protein
VDVALCVRYIHRVGILSEAKRYRVAAQVLVWHFVDRAEVLREVLFSIRLVMRMGVILPPLISAALGMEWMDLDFWVALVLGGRREERREVRVEGG